MGPSIMVRARRSSRREPSRGLIMRPRWGLSVPARLGVVVQGTGLAGGRGGGGLPTTRDLP